MKVVEFILDRVGFDHDDSFFKWEGGNRKPRFIYDCASGSGSFLVECARRIRDESKYDRNSLIDLLQVRDVIIKGLYGSEISAFAYYISEVNLLLQLTPIIKRILLLDPDQHRYQGKFTLGLLRQDSLKLHAKRDEEIVERDIEKEYETSVLDEEYVGRPKSEKASVFTFIKNGIEFDFCVANPPYIGESKHKELFRNTIRDIPYWKSYHQGKMDYLYWFIILALSKLKQGGKLGFITTSYWPTANGAQKLKKYILENALIKEIVFFGQVKLFKDAQGQNSLIFILEKEHDEKEKKNNYIKIVKTIAGKGPHKPSISSLIDHIRQHIEKDRYSDSLIEVFQSPVAQGELKEDPWFIFNKLEDDEIIAKMIKVGKRLDSLFNIDEGLVTGCNKVDRKLLDKMSSYVVEKYSVRRGDGVFVLNRNEANLLGLTGYEKDLLKPFYKSSNIQRYWINDDEVEYVLYVTKESSEDKIPNILVHLAGDNNDEKFKPTLAARRECKEGKIPWYSLWWPREKRIFEQEKIVFPYRSPVSRFAYINQPFYGASDMYFITEKSEISERINLKYLLGILNSSLFRFWFRHRSNSKDGKQEIFGNRMGSFPVVEINPSDKIHTAHYDRIVKLVSSILSAIHGLHELQRFYSESLFDFQGIPKKPSICKLHANYIIKGLTGNAIRKFRSSELLRVNTGKDDFKIQSLGDIQYNLHGKRHIVVAGDKQTASIEGEKDSLLLLKEILGSYIGHGYKATMEDILFPVNIRDYYKMRDDIIREHTKLYMDVKKNQKQIDTIVCNLYGIKPSEII